MAPGANIRYYGAASCFDDDFLDTLGRVVDENVAQIVTNSWGDLERRRVADAQSPRTSRSSCRARIQGILPVLLRRQRRRAGQHRR